MAVFVLVHGSMHGGWCWKKVLPYLQQKNHIVYTPTLTGLGERSHLASPEVGLSLHIQDVLQVLEYEDLNEVFLVGHSYAGMVITGVAELSDRVSHLIYLDAFVPKHGQSAFDITPVPGHQDGWSKLAEQSGDGWLVPSGDSEGLRTMGIEDPKDIAWMEPRMTPMPLLTHSEPLYAPQKKAANLPSTYILCKQFGNFFRDVGAMTKAAGWNYVELDAGHEAMITMPKELAAILNTVVENHMT